MKRKFALAVSVMAALLVVTSVLALTSAASSQAAPLDTDRVAASTAVASKIVVNELYRSGSFNATGDEWVELLLISDLTAAELGNFYFGDSTSSVVAKFSGYRITNTLAIASTFRKGTLIVIGGGGTVTDTISYDPAAGDWNIVLAATGAYLSSNGSLGDFAATDVAYVDTNGTNGNASLSADGFAVKWGTTTGAFGNVANLTVTVPNNGTGLMFTSTLDGITIPTNWASSVVSTSLTRGQPNGGDNTTYIESLRSALAPKADLGVSKDGPATALAGETITYTISLSNTGTTTATGTLVTDTLPAKVTFVTYTTALPNAFARIGSDLVWDLGAVANGASGKIDVQVTISPALSSGASFTNTVTASTTYTESNQANNTDSVTTFIGAPDLVIVKTGPASVNPGDTFTYTLAYTNAGTINATNVAIVDYLPAGVIFVTETTGSATFPNGLITWPLGTLNAHTGGSILLTVTARYAGDWVNTATISGGPIDSDPLNNTSSVTTTINGADPYVLKSGPATVFGGEVVTYTLTYGNFGNVTATATLTDQLPIGFTASNIAFDGSGVTPVDGVAGRTWTVNINPNSEISFTLALTVPASITSGTRITNALSISAIESGDDPIDNTASVTSTVYQIVPIATARAGSNGQVFAVEGRVTYVPGTYNASGWGVQDDTGGIAVYYTTPPAPSVALGDRVRLVATRGVNTGEKQLASPVYYFAKLGSGPQVDPTPFTTGAVVSGTADGWLNVISGTLSGLTTCTGQPTLLVNDGSGAASVFIDADTTINACNLANGDFVRITGFGTLFNALYEIKPRFPADIVKIHQPAQNLSTSTKTNAINGAVRSGDLVTYTIRLINTGDLNATARITDVVAAYYTVGNALAFTQPTTGTLTWTGVVTAGQTVNVQFVARVKPVGQMPIGLNLLSNSATVNDGLHPVFTLDDQTPPMITIYGVYLPLVRR